MLKQHSLKEKDGCSNTKDVVGLTIEGEREFSSGNHAIGIKLITDALDIVEKQQHSSAQVANLLTILGNMYRQSGINNGFKQHIRALEIRQQALPNTEAEAESEEMVGTILITEHQYSDALGHFEQSLRFHESQNPSSMKTAVQYTHVGQVQQSLGRLNDAYESFQTALLIIKTIESTYSELANVHLMLGRVLREQGTHLEAAETHLNEAISLYYTDESSILQAANSYVELGKIKGAKGSLSEELFHYEKALEIQNKVAANSLDLANTLHQIGLSYFKRGTAKSAEKHMRDAIAIRKERAPLSLALAESFYCLGDILKSQGEISEALEYHRQALELRSILVPLSLDVADSFHAMGTLSEETGRWQEALNYYSREFIARDTDAVETAKVHNSIGNILMKETDRINDAVSNHQMAVAIQSSHGESAILAKYLEDLIISIREKGESSSEYEQQLEKIKDIV